MLASCSCLKYILIPIQKKLQELLGAKKKDKLDIAAAQKEYRECNKGFSRAERRLKAELDKQEEQRQELWRFILVVREDNLGMEEKIQEKLNEKRIRDEEEALWRAQEAAENGEDVPQVQVWGGELSVGVDDLEESLRVARGEMVDLVNAQLSGAISTLRMQHEKGDLALKIVDHTGFLLGSLIAIGSSEDHSMEVPPPFTLPILPFSRVVLLPFACLNRGSSSLQITIH